MALGSSELTFEEEGHIYRVGELIVPSITQIIGAIRVRQRDGTLAGWFDYSFLKEAKSEEVMARGTWVADLCATRINRGVPFSNVIEMRLEQEAPEWFKFYRPFEPWLQRAHAVGFQALLVEQPLYSPRYRFAGRPDLVCIFQGIPSVIELKTGIAPDETRVQTVAQVLLLEEAADYPYRREPHRRFALELPGDGGDARLIEHKNHARDRSHFLAALTLFQAFNETNGSGK